jgi:thiaminase
MKKTTALMFCMLYAIPALARAADRTAEHPPSLGEALVSLLPFFIIMGVVVLLLRRAAKRNKPYMERATVHMERVEKQNERIIALLEEIAGKKDGPEHVASADPAGGSAEQ